MKRPLILILAFACAALIVWLVLGTPGCNEPHDFDAERARLSAQVDSALAVADSVQIAIEARRFAQLDSLAAVLRNARDSTRTAERMALRSSRTAADAVAEAERLRERYATTSDPSERGSSSGSAGPRP